MLHSVSGLRSCNVSIKLGVCMQENCAACTAIIDEKRAMLPALQTNLQKLYKEIRSRAKKGARIIIADYPSASL